MRGGLRECGEKIGEVRECGEKEEREEGKGREKVGVREGVGKGKGEEG